VATPQLNPWGNLTGGFAGGWLAGGEGLRSTRPEHDAAATPTAAVNIDVQNRRRVSLGRTTVPTTKSRQGGNLIKPLGLCLPLSLLLFGAGLLRARRVPVWVGWGIVVAAAAYPVSRIGNIAWLALIDTVLLVCLSAIPFVLRGRASRPPCGRRVRVRSVARFGQRRTECEPAIVSGTMRPSVSSARHRAATQWRCYG
jgi:hypothetical protein